MTNAVIDTNVLLTDAKILTLYDQIIIPIAVLEELDGLKQNQGDIGFKARKAIKALEQATNVTYDVIDNINAYEATFGLDLNKRDNQIILSAKLNNTKLITNDIAVKIKASQKFNIPTESFYGTLSSYRGYREFVGDTDYLNKVFQDIHDISNPFELLENEYIIMTDTYLNESIEYRYSKLKLHRLVFPDTKRHSALAKQIKAKNSLQRCAIDLLHNKDIPIKIIMGGYGSGKTYLSTQIALHHVRDLGLYQTILCVREPIGEGQEIGYLKGTKEDKTDDFFKPIEHSLAGKEFELQKMIQQGQLQKEIPYYMKGCTYNETIILCDEAEDIHYKQLKLIGTRLGTNSSIIFVGDYRQSVYDNSEYNGLIRLSEQLKGNPKVGIITLEEDVRSEASKIFADCE